MVMPYPSYVCWFITPMHTVDDILYLCVINPKVIGVMFTNLANELGSKGLRGTHRTHTRLVQMEKTSDPEKKRREAAEFLFTKKKETDLQDIGISILKKRFSKLGVTPKSSKVDHFVVVLKAMVLSIPHFRKPPFKGFFVWSHRTYMAI